MNVPNKLTLSRFLFTLAFLVALYSRYRFHDTIALAFFSLGGITDFLDGKIARSRNLITDFGILMDPLADKIMVCSAFIAFIERGWIAAWMVVIVVARELIITGLRLLAANKNIVLAAERYGKHKTISQIVSIISLLVLASYSYWGSFGAIFGCQVFSQPWIYWFASAAKWVAVILTFYSGVVYLWRNRQLYLTDL
jgi:CDP-diacylglycerol---glycerol-3-phosphate 3-phosphatidyltransferase